MLGHVVSVLVHYKLLRAKVKLLKERRLCFLLAMLKHSLNDTTAVRMRCKSVDLTIERVDDKLNIFRWNSFNSLLNDVVAILVFYAFQNMPVKFLYQSSLLICEDMFKCLEAISR